MDRTKSYPAILFRQRENAPLQVAFAAPSREIDAWARVPTKRTGNVRNFQRAEVRNHVKEVSVFFKNEENSSPTAVVVGFDPIRASKKVRTLLNGRPINDADVPPGSPVLGTLEISWAEENNPQDGPDYVKSIVAHRDILKFFIFAELRDITGLSDTLLDDVLVIASSKVAQGIEPEMEEQSSGAAEEVASGQDSELQLLDIEVPPEISVKLHGLSPSEQQLVAGRLYFLAHMTEKYLKLQVLDTLSTIYREVQDELKPGILIDGQHRVRGTMNLGEIPFLVTALPTAAWPELAFQFIVTNRTARKVPESLLISIVGNSLSKGQRADIEGRLRGAGIRVGLIEAVMRVQEDEISPFYGLISFGIQNEKGFLDAAAMRSKVIQSWFERWGVINSLFDHLCQGKKRADRTDYWKSEEIWFQMFVSFWSAVKERYTGSGVFSSEITVNPNSKQKEPASKLMTATVLKIFQETVLENIYGYLRTKQDKEHTPIAVSLPDEEALSLLVKNTLAKLTPEFFQGWEITGFDGSSGARDDLADAINKVLQAEKTVPQLKGGKKPHRLFRSESKNK